MNRSLCLGVDGGNAKTIALIADQTGRILGAGRSGCGDIYGAESAEAALDSIAEAVALASKQAGVQHEEIDSAAFSLAGADWPEDFEYLHEELTRRRLSGSIKVVHDSIGALRAGSQDGNGVSCVCGSGTAVGARNNGRQWHSSFWQQEACSGFALSQAAIRAVYDSDLGIISETSLTGRILDFLGEPSTPVLLHETTRRTDPKKINFNKLSRVVLDAAADGDKAALNLVRSQAATVADFVIVAARRVDIGRVPFTLVLCGGVLRHESGLVPNEIVRCLEERGCPAVPTLSDFEPVVGAVLLAYDEAGIAATQSVRACLADTMPDGPLFVTA